MTSPAMTAAAPLRHASVSNATFLALAEAAGATIGVTRGEFTDVVLPNRRRIKAQAAHARRGNALSTFRAVEDAVGARRLWALYDPATDSVIGADPEPEPNRVDDAPLRRGSGNSNRVLEVLNGGEVLSTDQLASRCGLDRDKAGSAANYLVGLGLAERVKNGMFRVPPAAIRPDHVVELNLTTPAPEAQVVPIHQPAPPVAPQPAPEVAPLESPVDDTVTALLDVIFPNGMRLTGTSLALVDEWRAVTVRLLHEIGSD